MWSALHTAAWRHPRDPTAEQQRRLRDWLADWAARLPRHGCPCRNEWRRILTICPPPLHDGQALYWWTVAAHDRVNRKLHKPLASEHSLPHPLLLAP
jgi:hypothetical protein